MRPTLGKEPAAEDANPVGYLSGDTGIGLAPFCYKLSLTPCLQTLRRLTIICLICLPGSAQSPGILADFSARSAAMSPEFACIRGPCRARRARTTAAVGGCVEHLNPGKGVMRSAIVEWIDADVSSDKDRMLPRPFRRI